MKYHPVVVCFNQFMVSSSKVNYALENFDHKVGLQKSPFPPPSWGKIPTFIRNGGSKRNIEPNIWWKTFHSLQHQGTHRWLVGGMPTRARLPERPLHIQGLFPSRIPFPLLFFLFLFFLFEVFSSCTPVKGIFKNDWLQGNEDLELFLDEIREIFRNGTNEQVEKRINKKSINWSSVFMRSLEYLWIYGQRR